MNYPIEYKSNKHKQQVAEYIREVVRTEDDTEGLNDLGVALYLKKRIVSEGFELQQTSVESWLRGMALNVDHYHSDVVSRVLKWNDHDVLPEKLSDRAFHAIVDRWWPLLAMRILQMVRPAGLKALGEAE